MKIVDGNIFNCTEDIIVHQTNCQGVMGHGIALQVRQKYPEVFELYRRYCVKNSSENILGTSLICKTNDNKYIANLFGQLYYGEGLQTDYARFEKALLEVRSFAIENNLSIALPYKIGCGLANGNWEIVSNIIFKVLNDVPYTIYRFERNEKY